jgi:hypothetical protein
MAVATRLVRRAAKLSFADETRPFYTQYARLAGNCLHSPNPAMKHSYVNSVRRFRDVEDMTFVMQFLRDIEKNSHCGLSAFSRAQDMT